MRLYYRFTRDLDALAGRLPANCARTDSINAASNFTAAMGGWQFDWDDDESDDGVAVIWIEVPDLEGFEHAHATWARLLREHGVKADPLLV